MAKHASAELLGRLLADHGRAFALHASHWTSAAEDCVQEALVELAGLPRLPDRPEAWLFRRVRQRALNAARAARRRHEHESAAWQYRLIATTADPTEAIDLVEALGELPAEDRELVTLRFYSNLTYDEIAETVGLSKSSAQRRTEKALSQLRSRLEAPCEPTLKKTTPSSGVTARP